MSIKRFCRWFQDKTRMRSGWRETAVVSSMLAGSLAIIGLYDPAWWEFLPRFAFVTAVSVILWRMRYATAKSS